MPSSPPADIKRTALHTNANAANTPPSTATIPVTAPTTTHVLQMCAAGFFKPLRSVLCAHPKVANSTDDRGRTPLHVASAEGHAHIVSLLLAAGADPSALDNYGNTPVREAARYGNVKVLRTYAEHDVELPGNMLHQNLLPHVAPARALFDAAANGDKRAATVAVAAFGAHVNSVNSDGRTPLHIAVAAGHVAVAAYLISAGADVSISDRWGTTPTREAQSSKNDMMRALFEGVSAAIPPRAATSSEPNTGIRRRVASLPRIVRAGSLPHNPIASIPTANVHITATTSSSTIASTSTASTSTAPVLATPMRSSSEPTEMDHSTPDLANVTPLRGDNNNNNSNKRHSAPVQQQHFTNLPHESVAPFRSEPVELVPHPERTRLHFEVAQ